MPQLGQFECSRQILQLRLINDLNRRCHLRDRQRQLVEGGSSLLFFFFFGLLINRTEDNPQLRQSPRTHTYIYIQIEHSSEVPVCRPRCRPQLTCRHLSNLWNLTNNNNNSRFLSSLGQTDEIFRICNCSTIFGITIPAVRSTCTGHPSPGQLFTWARRTPRG